MSCSEKQMIQRLWQNLTVRPQRLGSSAQYLQSPASSGAGHRLDLYKDTMGYKDNYIKNKTYIQLDHEAGDGLF